MSDIIKSCNTCGATLPNDNYDYCDRACFMMERPAKPTFTKEDIKEALRPSRKEIADQLVHLLDDEESGLNKMLHEQEKNFLKLAIEELRK